MFGQYGYRRTSTDDIAREAGIGKGTIYLSFAGKDEVFQALSEALMQRMLAGADAARLGPGTTADRLAAMSAAGMAAPGRRRQPQRPGALHWGAVASDERTLLYNLLDSLDRLYDRDCGPVDVGFLLTATAGAIRDQSWIAVIEQASAALRDLVRSGLPAEEQYRKALIVTNPNLRLSGPLD